MKYELGTKIRKYRQVAGLSQKELASRLGISNSRVSNWEQGINRPDADMLADICRVLEVSPSDLLGVTLTDDEFSSEERALIAAYRAKPDVQQAVKILLGVEES